MHLRPGTPIAAALFLATLVSAVAGPAPAGPWAGMMIARDGVPHVENPETPMQPPREVSLEPLWNVGTDPEDEIFGRLTGAAVDGRGNVYLLDEQLESVCAFSPSGEFLGSLGRSGEGPGEFRQPTAILMLQSGLIGVASPYPPKIVRYEVDGTPAGDLGIAAAEFEGGRLILESAAASGPHLVALLRHNRREGEKRVQVTALVGVGAEDGALTTFLSRREERTPGTRQVTDRDVSFDRGGWSLAPDGRVFARLQRDAYEIGVFAPGGTLERVIHRPGIAPLQRTPDEMAELEARVQIQQRGGRRRGPRQIEFDFAPTHPMILRLLPRSGGQLWVRTCRHDRELPSGVIERLDAFDGEGRLLQEIHIRWHGQRRPWQILYTGELAILLGPEGMLEPGGDTPPEDEGAGSEDDEEIVVVLCCRVQP